MDANDQFLDEEIRAAIRLGGKREEDLSHFTPAKARALQDGMARAFKSPHVPAMAHEDMALPGETGPLACRLYRPDAACPPLILFIHGGGWVGGDLETHDQMCRLLGSGTGAAMLALTYRLAPEHPFPAAVEDCVRAVRRALQSVEALGCDPSRIAIFGESAGANLAAVSLLSLADEPLPRIGLQCLAYPASDLRLTRIENDASFDPLNLTLDEALWCRAQYVPDDKDLADWRASPILARNLAASPPTHLIIAGVDPLNQSGEAYAEALIAAGVPTTVRRYSGLPHGFLSLPPTIPRIAQAYSDVCNLLRAALPSVTGRL